MKHRLVLIKTLFACLGCEVVAALGLKIFSPRQLPPGEVWTPSQFHAARKQRSFCVTTIRLWVFLSKCCSVNTLVFELNTWARHSKQLFNLSSERSPSPPYGTKPEYFSHQFSQIFSQPQSKKTWKDVDIYQLGEEIFYIYYIFVCHHHFLLLPDDTKFSITKTSCFWKIWLRFKMKIENFNNELLPRRRNNYNRGSQEWEGWECLENILDDTLWIFEITCAVVNNVGLQFWQDIGEHRKLPCVHLCRDLRKDPSI